MVRKYIQLNDWDRSRIMFWKASGRSVREISRTLRRAPSTISRELRRNGYKDSYSASLANEQARKRRVYTNKLRKLWLCSRLKSYVIGRIKHGWSPELISGRLAAMVGKNSDYYISHETIYASIYALPRGELRKEIISALRQSRKKNEALARIVLPAIFLTYGQSLRGLRRCRIDKCQAIGRVISSKERIINHLLGPWWKELAAIS